MNLLKMNEDNIYESIEELENEKVKLLARLAEIYSIIARLDMIQDSLNVTKHFEKEREGENVPTLPEV